MFGKKKKVLHAREILVYEIARAALAKWAWVKDNSSFEFGAVEIMPDAKLPKELRVSGYGTVNGLLIRFDMLVMNTEKEPELCDDGYRCWPVLQFSVQPKNGPQSLASLVNVGKRFYGPFETGAIIADTSIDDNLVVLEMEASSKRRR